MTKPVSEHLHFIGVGGVSMHALAEWCVSEGYTVSGCDSSLTNESLPELRKHGVQLFCEHDEAHVVADVDTVVHSMAVPVHHPELVKARELGLKVITRIELLAELFERRKALAVTGTHGKSSTSGMIATALLALEPDNSVQLGATLPSLGGNMRYGAGDWLVAEVDESDPGFANLASEIAIVTNLDDDHVADGFDERRNYHASLAELEHALAAFAARAKTVLYCADWPILDNLQHHARPVSYGLAPSADYRVTNVSHGVHDVRFTLERPNGDPVDVQIGVPGLYNALNGAAAIAALELAGFPAEQTAPALADYHGVGRRWQRWGTYNGAELIDDYAHHPTEITATLTAARQTGLRVRAVVQPHRWIRTARMWKEIADAAALADEAIVLPVFAAGEAPVPGISTERIVERINERGTVGLALSKQDAVAHLLRSAAPNELIITLGAGDGWEVVRDLHDAAQQGHA